MNPSAFVDALRALSGRASAIANQVERDQQEAVLSRHAYQMFLRDSAEVLQQFAAAKMD